MRRLKNIFISGILSVCMVVTSLPVELMAQEAETVQDNGNDRLEDTQDKVQYEIISFAELPESVKNQSVALGTDIEELELPENLTASFRSFKEKPEDNTGNKDDEKDPEENSGDEGGEKEPEDNTGDEDDEKEPEENSGDEGGEKDSGDNTEDEDEGKTPEENPEDEGKDKDNGSEKSPETGDNEKEPESASEGAGKDNEPEVKPEVGDGTQTPENKTESENKMPGNASETKDGKSEAESAVPGTEDAGKAEPTVKEKTVEVHMKEYNAQPEYMDEPKTLVSENSEYGADLSGETAINEDSDSGLSEETEKNTDSDSGLSEEAKPESGLNTNLTEETCPEADTNKDKNEGNVQENSIETIVIDNVTWVSVPEYDADVEGNYIFTPILQGNYILAEGIALPEIIVTVGEAEKADLLEEVEEPVNDEEIVPAIGVIDTDTTWTSGTLTDGTVTIKEGVTLTITGDISISGQVTIEGGGRIERGDKNACFNVNTGGNLTIDDITVDGKSMSAPVSMIHVLNNSELILNEGCVIRNCVSTENGGAINSIGRVTLNGALIEDSSSSATNAGGAIYALGSTVILNDATIRNCSATSYVGNGGAIYINSSNSEALILNNATIEGCSSALKGGAIVAFANVVIKGGTYKNNVTRSSNASGYSGGGFIYICSHTLKIYSGNFINNGAANKGGCIYNCGDPGTTTYLYGGRFEGNTCSNPQYSGSGAICNSAYGAGATSFILSGSIEFVGDGQSSGTDGIFLDSQGNLPRMLWLRDALSYPISIYLSAEEGYIIAEGMKMDNGNEYTILKNRDIKKMSFYDTNGKTWYPWLNEDNQVYLSETPPFEERFFVYYINNGAEGLVEDDNKNDSGYVIGETTIVQSADGLIWEDHEFVEWNTQADGNGKSYNPDDTLEITGDIDLYAIFRETQGIAGTFYSGGANRKEIKSANLVGGADSVTIATPDLKDMEGWTKLGWDTEKDSYEGRIAAGTSLTISENTSYYGVYERDVTLSYNANGGDDVPDGETVDCLANVHEDITYKTDGVRVARAITADRYPDWEFAGWNTKADGTGDLYKEGDIIKISEDTTLFATFETPPYAYFYSGAAGEANCEVKKTNVVTKKIIAPPLKEKSGWKEIGWDEDNSGYGGRIKPGDVLKLTDYTSYYGVYIKEVTLMYSMADNEYEDVIIPPSSTQTRYANVHKEAITYNDSVSGDPESFEFNIASDISYAGYEFIGWNTKEDGTGTFYRAGDADRNKILITQDTTLYAILRIAPVAEFYSGEAGQHEAIKGEFNYSINATVTAPDLEEMNGWEPIGWSMDETGYSLNNTAGSVISLAKDTSFYGIYKKQVELTYDANDWAADKPDTQSGFSYAKVYNDITYAPVSFTTAPAITRSGYSFVGWSTSRNVDESSHIYRPDESIEMEDSITLYAQMIDDITPVLGEASYNSGYKDIEDWIVRKKDMVITVPVTEEGSGVNKIVYTLTPENGEPVTGEAFMGDAYVPRQVRQAAVVQLDVVGGKMNVASGRTDVNIDTIVAQDTTAGKQPRATGGQVGTTDGQIQAKITISEDYKGTISLKCIDNAGNESADKLLTATDGGVIVEDNAPQISFVNKKIKNSKAVVTISVSDDVDTDKKSRITGGIASITYQVDDKQEQNVTAKNFTEEIVPACEFSVDISGAGQHTLKVTAVDNAGNESQQSTNVIIAAPNKKTTVIKQDSNPPTEEKKEFVPLVKVNKPEMPKDSEPATGDNSMRVEVYATIAMIAGLLYVLLYFITGPNGMTEEEKNETVSRILSWAKKGGRCRRFAAIAAIFFILFYYHSIGKRINVQWKEVVGS